MKLYRDEVFVSLRGAYSLTRQYDVEWSCEPNFELRGIAI